MSFSAERGKFKFQGQNVHTLAPRTHTPYLNRSSLTTKMAIPSRTVENREKGRSVADMPVRVIEARPGWRWPDLREIVEYRDLLLLLVWRSIKGKYAQTVLGVGWAVVQPLFFMVVFTIIFGRLIGVSSNDTPYAVFSYVALVPWTFFSTSVMETTDSLIRNNQLLSKVYFPRVILPTSIVLSKLVDFAIASLVIVGMMAWYGIVPTIWVLTLPLLVAIVILAALGLGMFTTALAVQYRDIRYFITFGMQGLIYGSPVVYPTSLIPEKFQIYYAINPMTGVIEGMRSALLGSTPMPWDLIGVSAASALAIFIGGVFYFSRNERHFADVV